jgi:hypothetical protein
VVNNLGRVKIKMRKQILTKMLFGLLCLIILGVCLLPAQIAMAANPNVINFQGKVVNADGTNVTDGSYSFRFRLYSSTYPTDAGNSCTANSCKWEETKTISVTNGIFQTELGDTTAMIDVSVYTDLYLGIRFNNDAQGEMNPRVHLGSVPYAMNADKLGGLTSSGFAQLAQGVQVDTSTTNPSLFINKNNSSGSPNILQLQKAGADVFTINNSGLVTALQGLTITAGKTLTVNGDGLTDLTGNGIVASSGALTINVASATDGLSATTSAGSGLEVLASGLTLLQGCSDTQILKWGEASDTWACAADNGAGSTTLNQLLAATAANTPLANANFAQVWNWGTLTTQTGLTLGGGTAMTSGSVLQIGSATYAHDATSQIGNLINISVTDSTSAAIADSLTVGLNINSTVNVSSATAGTKQVEGLNIAAPVLTACNAATTCIWDGIEISTQANTNAQITQNGLKISSAGTSSAGTIYGINIDNISAGAATEIGHNIGSWPRPTTLPLCQLLTPAIIHY